MLHYIVDSLMRNLTTATLNTGKLNTWTTKICVQHVRRHRCRLYLVVGGALDVTLTSTPASWPPRSRFMSPVNYHTVLGV